MTLLEATGLSKHFGALTAVDDLSLTIEPGEAYGLVGPDASLPWTARPRSSVIPCPAPRGTWWSIA